MKLFTWIKERFDTFDTKAEHKLAIQLRPSFDRKYIKVCKWMTPEEIKQMYAEYGISKSEITRAVPLREWNFDGVYKVLFDEVFCLPAAQPEWIHLVDPIAADQATDEGWRLFRLKEAIKEAVKEAVKEAIKTTELVKKESN